MNSSMKHSHMASVVSSSVARATPESSIGSSKSNSFFGIKAISCPPSFKPRRAFAAEKFPGEISLHHLVLRIRRQAFRSRFPRPFSAEPAVFCFRDTDEAFLRHRVDRVVVRLAAEEETHELFRFVKQRVGLVHGHVPVARHRLL